MEFSLVIFDPLHTRATTFQLVLQYNLEITISNELYQCVFFEI